MYEEFFRLTDAPFRLNPDPRFFYGSRSHNKAMAYLHYGVKQAEGFIVITGPVGAGKSMVIGQLLDQLNASNVVAANLLTSNIEPQDLLSQILSAFRIEPENDGRAGEMEAFEDYLFDQLDRGRRVLLIIDEAQNLPFKTLEELRMLSNIDYEGTPLFQVFLVGQPEFRTTMEAQNMEQLRQRVIASYHLEPLSEDETRDYILHRLAVAGWREDPAFTKSAFKAIHQETQGLPRRINTLCNRLMLYCSLEEAHDVTAKVVAAVNTELQEEKLQGRERADKSVSQARLDSAPEKASEQTLEDKAEAEPAPQTNVLADLKDAVALSLDEPQTIAEEASAEKPAPKAIVSDKTGGKTALASSLSVLDRLRSKQAGAEDRQEASLSDIADAIAAATQEQQSGPEGEPAALKARPKRKGVRGAIEDIRDDLKEANAKVVSMSKASDNARARRAQIADSLARANSLLNDLRQAQG